jgi:nitrogen-specific signal transduction histidine kinase
VRIRSWPCGCCYAPLGPRRRTRGCGRSRPPVRRYGIEVTISRDTEGAEIIVADDGPGIIAEQAPYVFDRFVSLDGRGGSGLGLAIARELADAQGGHLDFSAARFVLRLPTPRHGADVAE